MDCNITPVPELHQGDVGTEIIITLKDGDEVINLTGYTTINIILSGKNRVVKTAEIVGDPEDGVIKYTTAAGDLVPGKLIIQVYLESPNWTGHSEAYETWVYPII